MTAVPASGAVPVARRHLVHGFWPRSAAVAAAALLVGVTASSDDGLILCPVRRCSGGYCPGCGLTRATGHVVRGDLGASLAAHPLLVVLLGQFIALLAARTALGSGVDTWLRSKLVPVVLVNGVLLVAVWLARLAAGDIPAPFAG